MSVALTGSFGRRLTQTIVYEGSEIGPIKARTYLAYDGTALTCVTGAPQHDDAGYGCSFNIRGNATSVTRYADPANAAGAKSQKGGVGLLSAERVGVLRVELLGLYGL